ncbi:MAG TPA: glycerol-3-phosphate dehydrogenase/oxidase [Candidatus Acidoferrum sp.]|nr:glycerol-3-phosphate dehydrogenase/oxidase [Candidatus Acidoferrum sp.]
MSISAKRDETRSRLCEGTLDVLVVGGGIVGSGVARDAAMRGLRVGLIEQQDFAAGTSSRSSRLLHGGLRYLEQGRVKLVHEASVEKKTIHRIAPHLSHPLGFIFPTYRGEGRPLWQLRVGVKIYDLLCGGRNFQPSRGFSRIETLDLLPRLKSENLAGAVRYFDALTNDARLVIDTLRSAERHDAALLNYARFHDAQRDGATWRCDITDQVTGAQHSIRARTIVNATGPWANKVPHSAVKLRLSKGIHIVIDHARLPVPSAVVITEGKRILFVLPWGERVIIGTTDTDFHGAPEDVVTDAQDVAYVLRAVNDFFPEIELRETDIVSTWAGVRPLIANPDGSPSDISRAHQIRCPEPGWWDIAGGKLTTYRLMAEQATDQIVQHLGVSAKRCRTAIEPLLGPEQSSAFSGIQPPVQSLEAIEHYVRNEWAMRLDDVLLRRAGWHYYNRMPASNIEQVAGWMAQAAGWSAGKQRSEVESWQQVLNVS